MSPAKEISYKKIPVLKMVIILMVIISIIFQSIISYINQENNVTGFLKDTFVTICAESIFSVIIYFIITFFQLVFKNKWKWIRYPLEFSAAFFSCLYILYFIFILLNNTPLSLEKLITRGSFRLHVSLNMVAVIFIYAFITILNFYQEMLEKTAATAKLEKEYARMRLHALKSQVNPHFLFNSLSVLSSLVRADPVTSEAFIIQLSKAYRYILEQKETQLVTLKDELAFLDSYFFLLNIRFDNKVILEQNIEEGMKEFCLPPLTLQMLVENAVKHNKMSAGAPLVIHVYSNEESIYVKNNLSQREENIESTGLGLENIRSRIAYMTDKRINIITDDKFFEVEVPLVKN